MKHFIKFASQPLNIMLISVIFFAAQCVAATTTEGTLTEKSHPDHGMVTDTHAPGQQVTRLTEKESETPGEHGPGRRKAERTEKKSGFQPAERIAADQAVAFPVDI